MADIPDQNSKAEACPISSEGEVSEYWRRVRNAAFSRIDTTKSASFAARAVTTS